MGAGIADAIAVINSITGQAKAQRLHLEKVIKREKEERRCALIDMAASRVYEHIDSLNQSLPQRIELPQQVLITELSAAIRGLKSLASMQNALDRAVLQRISAINEKARQAEGSESKPQPAAGHAARFDLSIEEINAVLWPIFISSDASDIEGLPQALHANDWTAAKRCLIAHIERAEFE